MQLKAYTFVLHVLGNPANSKGIRFNNTPIQDAPSYDIPWLDVKSNLGVAN